ncbi:MAG: MBL fold metallo-hydrolase [Planctomycetota bacterium]
MLLKYFYDQALAHASYMVGCQKTGEAIVIDPGRDIEQYLEAADKEGLRIVGAADTHIHADYVSGALELAERVGAKLFVSDEGPAEWKYEYASRYKHQLLKDGDTFSAGLVELKVMHTPGHTPESLSFVLTDKGGGADQPMGIFSGDFVFVGSIGRPDLLEEAAGIMGTAEPGARDLFQSIKRFRELPDHLQVWPAHGAGSACGKGLGAIPSSTVGYEKMFNPALQYQDEQAFVDYILSEQPEAPRYFALMKRVNKEGPAVLREPTLPQKVEIDLLTDLAATEMVVDTIDDQSFASAHVEGTINIQPKHMAMWGGSLLDYEQPLYLIAGDDLAEAVRVLHKIGMDKITGYFSVDEVARHGLRRESIPQVAPDAVFEKVQSADVELIDVRGVFERQQDPLPNSQHLFLGKLFDTVKRLDAKRNYAFACRTGGRSMIAASIAQRAGVKNVINLRDGVVGWQLSGLPTGRDEPQTVG